MVGPKKKKEALRKLQQTLKSSGENQRVHEGHRKEISR
jgi:hypothetical protein